MLTLLSWLSSLQTGYLLLIAAMLVTRTYCDVWMIQHGTMIERSVNAACVLTVWPDYGGDSEMTLDPCCCLMPCEWNVLVALMNILKADSTILDLVPSAEMLAHRGFNVGKMTPLESLEHPIFNVCT